MCNHSECLAVAVYVCMCVLSVEMETVALEEYVHCVDLVNIYVPESFNQ